MFVCPQAATLDCRNNQYSLKQYRSRSTKYDLEELYQGQFEISNIDSRPVICSTESDGVSQGRLKISSLPALRCDDQICYALTKELAFLKGDLYPNGLPKMSSNRRVLMFKIKQVDKIFCCVLLTITLSLHKRSMDELQPNDCVWISF